MSLALEINQVSYAYENDKKALDGVSFSLEQGSYACIIGHNGSGKSTLAKLIMGLISGFDGEIKIFGEVLDRKSVGRLRGRMGIVFQNPDNQFVGSTVEDDIAFGLENTAVPNKEMAALVKEFALATGMEKELGQEPSSLSGGQKQRVAIAGVLAMRPELIIFDEATSMLDPKGKAEIKELIGKIRKENPSLSLISITHDLEEASKADEVIVLKEGKVLLSGDPRSVFGYADELRQAHLEVPFFFRLVDELKKNGVEIPSDIMTLEELEDYLCR